MDWWNFAVAIVTLLVMLALPLLAVLGTIYGSLKALQQSVTALLQVVEQLRTEVAELYGLDRDRRSVCGAHAGRLDNHDRRLDELREEVNRRP